MSREHEHTVNVWLASHLRGLGLDAKQEVIKPRNRRVDVEIRVGPISVAVEAEYGQTSAKQNSAIRDADARLKQKLSDCAIAICYPENVTEEGLMSCELIWSIRNPNLLDSDLSRWDSGTVVQLASVIRLMPEQIGDPDHLASILSSGLDRAVDKLSESQQKALSKRLDLPISKQNGRRSWEPAAKRSLLVIASAVMFHSRLDGYMGKLPLPSYQVTGGGGGGLRLWPRNAPHLTTPFKHLQTLGNKY